MLAEANVLPETDMEYFGADGDRMHMMFNFQVNQHLFYALAAADTRPLVKAMQATKPRPATAQWGLFLRNHDELDLGRLTKKQRQKVFAAFGPDTGDAALRARHPAAAGAHAGRRPPAAGARLQPAVHAARDAGHPLRRRNRHGRRSVAAGAQLRAHPDAMVERAAWRLHQNATSRHVPVISGGPYGFEHINAAIQRRHPNSLLNWTERIIRMRKEVPEVGWGDFAVIPTRNPAVLVMRYDWRNNWVLFVHNFDAKPHEITFLRRAWTMSAEHGSSGNLLARRAQSCRRARQTPACHRGLWLPLVSRGRTGLSAPAERDRPAGKAVSNIAEGCEIARCKRRRR